MNLNPHGHSRSHKHFSLAHTHARTHTRRLTRRLTHSLTHSLRLAHTLTHIQTPNVIKLSQCRWKEFDLLREKKNQKHILINKPSSRDEAKKETSKILRFESMPKLRLPTCWEIGNVQFELIGPPAITGAA